jgi:hypothetical protein
MCVPFVQRILVDIRCILIGKLHFDYMSTVFSLSFRWFLNVLVVLNAIFMSVFLNSPLTVLISSS